MRAIAWVKTVSIVRAIHEIERLDMICKTAEMQIKEFTQGAK